MTCTVELKKLKEAYSAIYDLNINQIKVIQYKIGLND